MLKISPDVFQIFMCKLFPLKADLFTSMCLWSETVTTLAILEIYIWINLNNTTMTCTKQEIKVPHAHIHTFFKYPQYLYNEIKMFLSLLNVWVNAVIFQ